MDTETINNENGGEKSCCCFKNCNFKNCLQSKKTKVFICIIGVLVAVCLAFGLGVSVGYHKANFSYRWGENYHKNFGGPRGGFLGNLKDNGLMMDRGFMNANGVFGQIIKIDAQDLVIKGQDNIEKIVSVKDDTSIRKINEMIKLSDLKIGDYVVVIGQPNDSGKIEAKFIRIMPDGGNFGMPMMRPFLPK